MFFSPPLLKNIGILMRNVFIQNMFLGYFHVYCKYFPNGLKLSLRQICFVSLYVYSYSIFPDSSSPATITELSTASTGRITEC